MVSSYTITSSVLHELREHIVSERVCERRTTKSRLVLRMIQGPAEGRIVLREGGFDGVKVFTATMFAERGVLGEKVTSWIAANPENQLTEIVVTRRGRSAGQFV